MSNNKKYVIEIVTRFEVETDDIKRTVEDYEMPVFPDLEDDAVEYLDGHVTWEEK